MLEKRVVHGGLQLEMERAESAQLVDKIAAGLERQGQLQKRSEQWKHTAEEVCGLITTAASALTSGFTTLIQGTEAQLQHSHRIRFASALPHFLFCSDVHCWQALYLFCSCWDITYVGHLYNIGFKASCLLCRLETDG